MQLQIGAQPPLLIVDVVITIVFLVFSVAALLDPSLDSTFVLFCLLLFVSGGIALLAGLVQAIARSRSAHVSLPGVFFLSDNSTPLRIRNWFLILLALQVLTSFAVASAAPFSATVFAVLVPQIGFGLMSLQGAFGGQFAAK